MKHEPTLPTEQLQIDTPTIHVKTPNYIWTISFFALFYLFNPAGPFLVEYLKNEKKFSMQQILFEIFPIWTYSYVIIQFIISFISESRWISHKTMILFGLIMSQITTLLVYICPLPVDTSQMTYSKFQISHHPYLFILQISEITVSISFATHTSFFGLRYHITEKSHFAFVTAISRGCMLLGNVAGSLLGQILVLLHVPLDILQILSIFACIPCIYIAMFHFPDPQNYIIPLPSSSSSHEKYLKSIYTSFVNFVKQIYKCYLHFDVLSWSIYSIISTAVHQLAVTYYQTLFREIDSSNPLSFNGFVMAVAYGFAGILSFFPAKMGTFLQQNGLTIAIGLLFLMGLLLLLLGFSTIIWTVWFGFSSFHSLIIAYVLFSLYHCLFEFLLVSANSQIAMSLKVNRFAAIFSFNTTVQNVVQLIIQFIVGRQVLEFSSRQQYQLYGFLMLGVGVLLIFITAAHKLFKFCMRYMSTN